MLALKSLHLSLQAVRDCLSTEADAPPNLFIAEAGSAELASLGDIRIGHMSGSNRNLVTAQDRDHRRAVQLKLSGNGVDRLPQLIHCDDLQLLVRTEVMLHL